MIVFFVRIFKVEVFTERINYYINNNKEKRKSLKNKN